MRGADTGLCGVVVGGTVHSDIAGCYWMLLDADCSGT